MAPHPPSSPITSEHPTDELKLKQGIQTASQATSTSRSTVDASDATSSNAESSSAAAAHPNASASHAQFHEWQDQRRCHSVLADYDYLHPTEDRRDPRSSNARLVMPVSQQSQTVACSSAHDRPASEMESHTSLQPPPIALQHDDDSANDGTCDTAPSHTGLGPSASLPLSPECNVSPSPSFAAYGYPDTPPHVSQRLSSSLSQDRPGTASASTSATASSHRLSSIAESSNERAGPTDACSTNHTASETSRPWTRATSLRFDQAEQRERSPLGEATHNASQSPDPFRLQPVPPSKRRKLDDSLAGSTHAVSDRPLASTTRGVRAMLALRLTLRRYATVSIRRQARRSSKTSLASSTTLNALLWCRPLSQPLCVTVCSEDLVSTRRSPRPIQRCEKRCPCPCHQQTQRARRGNPAKAARLAEPQILSPHTCSERAQLACQGHARRLGALASPPHSAQPSGRLRLVAVATEPLGPERVQGLDHATLQGAATEPRSLLCWNKQLTLAIDVYTHAASAHHSAHAARARPARDPQEPAAPSRRRLRSQRPVPPQL